MNLDQIRDVYDRHAPTYDQTVGFVENLLLRDLRRDFGRQLHGKTLEIAIGSGLNLPWYTPAVTSATGADLSAGMLREARKRADSLGRPVELGQVDAERLPFADQSFDTVAISLALCTIPNPRAAVLEMARVCKPDGRTVFLEHVRSPHWPVYAVERLWTPLPERRWGCSFVRDTVSIIEQADFRIVSDRSRLLGVFRLVVAVPPTR